jgi:hypothetical protein
MDIYRALILGFSSQLGLASSSQNRLDNLVPQYKQGCHSAQSLGHDLIPARLSYSADHVLTPEFLQIVGCLARCVRIFIVPHDLSHLRSDIGDAESMWSSSEPNHSFYHRSHPWVVDVNATDSCLTHTRGRGQCFQGGVPNGGDGYTGHDLQKSVQHFLQPQYNISKIGHRSPPACGSKIVDNGLNAQDVFAFGIHLEGELSKVDLEHRQVIRRSLDHDPQSRRLLAFESSRTLFGSEDGLELLDVQSAAGAINDTLKNLLHHTATREHQVATVLCLIDRVVVVEIGPFLILQTQSKAQTRRVDPSFAHLGQSPYCLRRVQGVCDFGHLCSVENLCEAVAFLCEFDASILRSVSHELVAIHHNLSAERRMPTQFDHNVAPLWVHNVERVVINIGIWFLSSDVKHLPALRTLNLPNRRRCPSYQDQKHASEVRGGRQMSLSDFMFPLPLFAMNDGNTMLLCIGVDTSAEPPCHTHQVSVVQILVGAFQTSPPHTETPWRTAKSEVTVKHNPVSTVVGAIQIIRVVLAELIRHIHHFHCSLWQDDRSLREIAPLVNCPKGAMSSGQSPGRRVDIFISNTVRINGSHTAT